MMRSRGSSFFRIMEVRKLGKDLRNAGIKKEGGRS
jgi:hypothetical protein